MKKIPCLYVAVLVIVFHALEAMYAYHWDQNNWYGIIGAVLFLIAFLFEIIYGQPIIGPIIVFLLKLIGYISIAAIYILSVQQLNCLQENVKYFMMLHGYYWILQFTILQFHELYFDGIFFVIGIMIMLFVTLLCNLHFYRTVVIVQK